jgi:acyl carrier protein
MSMSTSAPAAKDAVLSFLRSRGAVPNGDAQLRQFAYLDQGILDSFGIVEMVTELESQLEVRFSPGDLQSSEFRTVGGLIDLIERLRREQARD